MTGGRCKSPFFIAGRRQILRSLSIISVVLCLFLIVSPLGKIRLGGPKAEPLFGYVGLCSIAFAAVVSTVIAGMLAKGGNRAKRVKPFLFCATGPAATPVR